MSVIVTPSASSMIIRPRLARPAEMVVDRCHASSVWRWAGVRWIVKEGLRPGGVKRPLQKKYHYISCRQNGCGTSAPLLERCSFVPLSHPFPLCYTRPQPSPQHGELVCDCEVIPSACCPKTSWLATN